MGRLFFNLITIQFKSNSPVGFVIAGLFFCCTPVFSQPDFTIENYTTDNGLPQNSVKSILFDKQGYCWLATEMGLVRFDGSRFKTYSGSDVAGTSFLSVRSLATDKSKNIFAWLNNAGDITLAIRFLNKNLAPQPVVTSVKQKWIFQTGYFIANETVDALAVSANWKTNLEYFASDPTARTIFSSNGEEGYGVSSYREVNKEFIAANQRPASDSTCLFYFSKIAVRNLYPIATLSPAVILLDSLLIELRHTNTIRVWYKGVLQEKYQQLKGGITSNKAFADGQFHLLWSPSGSFIYCGNSLYRLRVEQNNILADLVVENIEVPHINCVYYLAETNTYFIGSGTKGLYVLRPSAFKYPRMPTAMKKQNFYPQVLTDSATIFASDILFSRYKSAAPVNSKSYYSRALYASGKKQIYYEDGFRIFRYDLNTAKKDSIGFLGSTMRALFQSRYYFNRLYVCSEKGWIGKVDSGRISKSVVIDAKLFGMQELAKDTFLLYGANGILCYDDQQKKVYKKVLGAVDIQSLFIDKQDRIWIGAKGAGILLIEDNKLYTMPLDARNALKTVHSFIEDKTGFFWLPTNDGLFKVRKESLLAYAHGIESQVYYYRFDRNDGLRTNEFNGRCNPDYIRFADGMLSLPSLDGLVWFYPERTPVAYASNKIFIEEIYADSQYINIEENKTLQLPAGVGELSIQASSPYFGIKENQQLEYKVEGISTVWRNFDGQLILNNLQYGNYTLVIKKLIGRTDNDYEYVRLSFFVQPRFYNTWWFWIFVFIVILISGFGISHYRERMLRRRAILLSAEVEERTRALNSSVNELRLSQQALQQSNSVKDSMTAMILHDIRSPLRFMDNLIQVLANHFSKSTDTVLQEEMQALKRTSSSLNQFTQTFFTWASSQHANFEVKPQQFNSHQLFTEMKMLYDTILQGGGNYLYIKGTNIELYTDKNILSAILRNLLDNANKNTQNGHLELQAEHTNNQDFLITVTDTGSGINANLLEQMNAGLSPDAEGHLGFKMVTELIEKMGGSVKVKSEQNKGTTVALYFPVLTTNGEL